MKKPDGDGDPAAARGAVTVLLVVVTYNSAHVVEGLLDSVPGALGDVDGHVVVVDNGSSDDTVAILEKRSDCTVVRSTNVGYSGGINRGVQEGPRCDAVLVLNPDARLTAGCVPQLLESLSRPGVGIVAPRILSSDGALDFTLRREPTLLRALGLNRTAVPLLSERVGRTDEYARACTVDWAVGAVLLISWECFESVGGWDESYFLYSEETDFCLRAKDLGYVTRYEPAAVAVHIAGESGRNHKTHVMQIVNRVRLYRRRHNAVAAWFYLGVSMLSELSWALRGHPQSWSAIGALVDPRRRPPEIGCSDRVIPS